MESPFTHNTIATGSQFLSRKKETVQLATDIVNGLDSLIFSSPKTGVRSLVYAALEMAAGNARFTVHELDLLSAVDEEDFTGPLSRILSPEKPMDEKQVVYLKNFQNVLKFKDWEKVVAAFEKDVHRHADTYTFIITGSGINAMNHIFNERKFFYRQLDRIDPGIIDEKSVTDHIIKTFLRVGRVVSQAQAEYLYYIAGGHPWYVWQLADTCFNLTKGYLSDAHVKEAVDTLLDRHSVRYQEIVDSLSRYQVYFLRAVFDGISHSSAGEVIENYRLNSSANVHRVKEALMKKEVITVDAQDTPSIIDPVFRLWLERFYFVR